MKTGSQEAKSDFRKASKSMGSNTARLPSDNKSHDIKGNNNQGASVEKKTTELQEGHKRGPGDYKVAYSSQSEGHCSEWDAGRQLFLLQSSPDRCG